MDNIHIYPTTDLGIREGSAPDVIIPVGQNVSLLPVSIPELFNKKIFDPASTLVGYNLTTATIEVETNIQSTSQKGSDKYAATFKLFEKLASFGINKDVMWELKKLGNHIKMNRNLFVDSGLTLAAQFNTLTATVNQKIEKHKEDRANSINRSDRK